ncbi:MAG TPA: hypothetical protein VMJ93_11175 [Verrucomicrobiae bacterium]|nr:hypothetical protein [Verrucomicrobiae bacterium]
MKHEKRHHSHAHHHRHEKPKIDLESRQVRLDGETYEWDDSNYLKDTKWFRYSRHSILRNEEKVPFVAEKDRDEREEDGHEIDWEEIKHRFRDRSIIRRLKRLVEHAERKQARRERKAKEEEADRLDKLREVVFAAEDARLQTPDSESAEEPEAESPAKEAGQAPKSDNKHGVQLFSNSGKYFFRIAVYKSKKYPGCSSVYLTVAGKRYLYTLDKQNMKAFREETNKGVVEN